MISTEELIRFVQESRLTNELKRRLLPIAKDADAETRSEIVKRVEKFNTTFEDLKSGKKPLLIDDYLFLVKEVRRIKKNRSERKTAENLR